MNLNEYLKTTFLFSDMSDEELSYLILKIGEIKKSSFVKNDTIKKQSETEKSVGFILSGQAVVLSLRDGNPVLLNSLYPTDAFGVVNLYSEFPAFPTQIVAKTKCEVAFLSKNQIDLILSSSKNANVNYIKFLSGRVAFLNQKISEVSMGSATEKLEKYLSHHFKSGDAFALNHKSVSLQLGIGRASLYRAIEELKESGFLTLKDKTYIMK